MKTYFPPSSPGLDDQDARGLRLSIEVIAGVGQGATPLSAFDAALWRCGIHDYNLLPVSSVIPPGSDVTVRDRHQAPPGAYGHKLYVVKAEMRAAEPGTGIAAGLGWLQGDDGSGLFVEHEIVQSDGDCERLERELAATILASLRDLAARRDMAFSVERTTSHIVAARVTRDPACVLVVATYQSEGWR